MAGNIRVWALVYQDGRVQDGSICAQVSLDAELIVLRNSLADNAKVAHYRVTLWKPFQFLARTCKEDLTSRLLNNNHDLNTVCLNLEDDDWLEKTVAELFGYTTIPSRDIKVPCLVLRIANENTAPARRVVSDDGGDILTELVQRFDQSRNEERQSPSQSAKPANYVKHQDGSSPILDGRHGQRQTLLAPPVEIYHPVFAAFRCLASDKTLEPPEDIVQATSLFMDNASKIVTTEQETRVHLTRLLHVTIDQMLHREGANADHVIGCTRKTEPYGTAALAIIEEKAGLGQSSEPSVQGEFSYTHYWDQEDQKDLSNACFCPSFIVSIAGPWFSVCGAIYTTNPIVQRLSAFEWLAHSRVIDDNNIHRLARIFHALRMSLSRLRDWYEAFVPDVADGPSMSRFFPQATQCTLLGGEVLSFRYVRPLKGSEPDCVTFLATDRNDNNRQFVVKFVERYGEGAHRLLAQHGYAPRLLYFGSIWPDALEQKGVGPRRMVIMEFIEGRTSVKAYPDGHLPLGVVKAVQKVLDILHGEHMVHGDIREPNILVEDGEGDVEDRIRVIDFDWAGIEGRVRYPLHLSDSIRWPKGVGPYKLIEASHDKSMLQKLQRMVA